MIDIQSQDLGLRNFNGILNLKINITSPTWFLSVKRVFSPVKEGVLQNKHDVLRKIKQSRKVTLLEGRRHISHSVLTQLLWDNKTGNDHIANVIFRCVHVTIHTVAKQ